MLEHYRIPGEIRKRADKKRIRVFRDRTDLSVSSDLVNEIDVALEEAEYLIVICSKEVVN